MKKITSIAASAALALSFNIGATTTASADPDAGVNTAVEACKQLVEDGFYDSVGDCMHNALNGAVQDICTDAPGFEAQGFKNKGQCMKFWRDLVNSTDFS